MGPSEVEKEVKRQVEERIVGHKGTNKGDLGAKTTFKGIFRDFYGFYKYFEEILKGFWKILEKILRKFHDVFDRKRNLIILLKIYI